MYFISTNQSQQTLDFVGQIRHVIYFYSAGYVVVIQLHVYTVTSLSGGPFDGSFRRCHRTTTEPLGGATACSFTCRCTDHPCLYVTARVFGNFGPIKSLCEIELEFD